MVKHKSDRKG